MNLNQLAGKNIESFLKEIGVEYTRYNNRVALPCPIHKSDSPESCCVYYASEFPYWKCFSHNCHLEGKGIVRLIAGLLDCEYYQAKRWVEDRVGKGDYVDSDRFSFIFENKVREIKENRNIMRRKDFLEKTKRPAQYFIERGFSKSILEKYDVGTWKVTGEIVVPVYDENHHHVIGYIERTPHKKCCLCDLYHDYLKPCPITQEEKSACRKWKNSFAFYSDQTFYNTWFAKEEIIKTKTVVLVEGQGDVWKMVGSGVNNCLGLFGVELKPGQRKILDDLGVQNIILFLDPDDAGQESANKIEERFSRYYNFYRMNSKYDPGDSSENYIRDQFNLIRRDLCIL